MPGQLLPLDMMPLIGKYLRQARQARRMSLAHIASTAGWSVDHLDAVEKGLVSETDIAVQWLVAFYGGVRGDKIDALLFDHAMRSLQLSSEQASTDRHLRLVSPIGTETERATSVRLRSKKRD